jgi:hypothetical protein
MNLEEVSRIESVELSQRKANNKFDSLRKFSTPINSTIDASLKLKFAPKFT